MNPFRGSFIEGRDGINSQKTDWILRVPGKRGGGIQNFGAIL